MSVNGVANRHRWVYSFKTADGGRRALLGAKGAELARMTSLGIPVPPGFTISTEACREYFGGGGWPPDGLWTEVESGMRELERATGRGFGDLANALLVSARSGAEVSMPGMMDTILNLGINREIVDGIVRTTADERFALDLHRRFIQMYAGVVQDVDANLLSCVVKEEQRSRGVGRSADLNPSDLRDIIDALRVTVADTAGAAIPDDPFVQLEHAVRAVFNSWNSHRATAYRDFHGIPHDLGTAVSVVTRCTGTWTIAAALVSYSRAIRRPGRSASSASICQTPRVKTWCRAWPRLATHRTWPRTCRRYTESSPRWRCPWRPTIATFRTWSSPWGGASCIFFRRAPDGATREVFLGAITTVCPSGAEDREMATLLGWADGVRRLGVWANADNPADAATARAFGAEGIGLCRAEHMFFEPARLSLVREMILAAHRSAHDPEDEGERARFHRTLKALEQLQTVDFEGIFRAMDGRATPSAPIRRRRTGLTGGVPFTG